MICLERYIWQNMPDPKAVLAPVYSTSPFIREGDFNSRTGSLLRLSRLKELDDMGTVSVASFVGDERAHDAGGYVRDDMSDTDGPDASDDDGASIPVFALTDKPAPVALDRSPFGICLLSLMSTMNPAKLLSLLAMDTPLLELDFTTESKVAGNFGSRFLPDFVAAQLPAALRPMGATGDSREESYLRRQARKRESRRSHRERERDACEHMTIDSLIFSVIIDQIQQQIACCKPDEASLTLVSEVLAATFELFAVEPRLVSRLAALSLAVVEETAGMLPRGLRSLCCGSRSAMARQFEAERDLLWQQVRH